MSKGGGALDWGALAAFVVHPTRTLVVEALLLDQSPCLCGDFKEIFASEARILAVSYHAKSLGVRVN